MRATSFMAVAAIAAVGAACGGGVQMGLTSDDNNPAALSRALGTVSAPTPNAPLNASGKPMVFVVQAGQTRRLVAYDLADKKELWGVDGDVESRVLVGRRFVAHLEGQSRMVGRDVASGRQLWSHDLGGRTFLGACADADRVYYVVQDKRGAKPVWTLVGVDGGSGAEMWHLDAPGQLGAPVARGGLVFSPFLKQWLSVIDGRTGQQVTRIRGIDEEISFVRATSAAVYYGSQAGVFLLDAKAASGKRAESTYGSAGLPKEFVRSFYHFDAFDPIQAVYSAYDRNRLLWRAHDEAGVLAFDGDRVVVHHYRFLFGFSAKDGALAWAYSHPRNDLVASEHLGSTIGVVSQMGEVGALDPATGALRYEAKVGGRVLGATFDADGWAPTEVLAEGEQGTRVALSAIAIDKDARFNDVKMFAVVALAKLPGGEVTRDLLALVQGEKTPQPVYDRAVQVLVDRKDAAGLPFLLDALAARYDFVTGAKPRGVGVIARAVQAIAASEAGAGIDPDLRARLGDALADHLFEPETAAGDLEGLARALGALGGTTSRAALRRFVLAYRADPTFSTQVDAIGAAVDALLLGGTVADREVVAFVAADAVTQPAIAEYASRALAEPPAPPATPSPSPGPAASDKGAAEAR